jgi:hypothetical protein
VIRAGETPVPRPSRPPRLRAEEGDAGAGGPLRGSRPEPSPGSGEPAFIYREPGPPGGPGALLGEHPDTEYGPDDPAYGPPSLEWYTRDKRAGQEEAAAAAASQLRVARGPFEPPSHQGGSGQELAPYQPVGYELPDAGEDEPIGGGTKALDQIKDFYLTAEAIGPENLDRHIEQLLERQRQLISEYFKETGLQENPQ